MKPRGGLRTRWREGHPSPAAVALGTWDTERGDSHAREWLHLQGNSPLQRRVVGRCGQGCTSMRQKGTKPWKAGASSALALSHRTGSFGSAWSKHRAGAESPQALAATQVHTGRSHTCTFLPTTYRLGGSRQAQQSPCKLEAQRTSNHLLGRNSQCFSKNPNQLEREKRKTELKTHQESLGFPGHPDFRYKGDKGV